MSEFALRSSIRAVSRSLSGRLISMREKAVFSRSQMTRSQFLLLNFTTSQMLARAVNLRPPDSIYAQGVDDMRGEVRKTKGQLLSKLGSLQRENEDLCRKRNELSDELQRAYYRLERINRSRYWKLGMAVSSLASWINSRWETQKLLVEIDHMSHQNNELRSVIGTLSSHLELAHYHLSRINRSPYWRLSTFLSSLSRGAMSFGNADEDARLGVADSLDDDFSSRANPENFLVVPFDQPVERHEKKIAVFLHAYYEDLIIEVRKYLDAIPGAFDLYISTDSHEKKDLIERVLDGRVQGNATVKVFPNRGRDIAPRFVGFAAEHSGYDLVLHIHTKKSPYSSQHYGWREHIFSQLLGSRKQVEDIIRLFEEFPDLGIVAPVTFSGIRLAKTWGPNARPAHEVAKKLKFNLPADDKLDYPVGAMFWARPKALKPLFDLRLKFEDFPEERGQVDGELQHVVERLFFLIAQKQGFKSIHVGSRDGASSLDKPFFVKGEEKLEACAARCFWPHFGMQAQG